LEIERVGKNEWKGVKKNTKGRGLQRRRRHLRWPATAPPPQPPPTLLSKKKGTGRERREHERKRESGIREMNGKLGLHPIYSSPEPDPFKRTEPAKANSSKAQRAPSIFFSFFTFCTPPGHCYTPPAVIYFLFRVFFRYFVSIAFILLFSCIFIHLRLLFCSHHLIVYLFLYFYFLVT